MCFRTTHPCCSFVLLILNWGYQSCSANTRSKKKPKQTNAHRLRPVVVVVGNVINDTGTFTVVVMDEDMQTALKEWLKEPLNEILGKSPSALPDIIEAIYGLIEEWKSNREVCHILSMPILLLLFSKHLHFCLFSACCLPMPSSVWPLQGREQRIQIQGLYPAVCS